MADLRRIGELIPRFVERNHAVHVMLGLFSCAQRVAKRVATDRAEVWCEPDSTTLVLLGAMSVANRCLARLPRLPLHPERVGESSKPGRLLQ